MYQKKSVLIFDSSSARDAYPRLQTEFISHFSFEIVSISDTQYSFVLSSSETAPLHAQCLQKTRQTEQNCNSALGGHHVRAATTKILPASADFVLRCPKSRILGDDLQDEEVIVQFFGDDQECNILHPMSFN